MLFMVVETFRNADPRPVGARFRERGRMMPDDVVYHSSWVDAVNARCYQLMEAPDRASLDPWIAAWNDLVEFEVVPVQTSVAYWSAQAAQSPS